MHEFRINEHISLKLENNKTFIYIDNKKTIQCIRVFIETHDEKYQAIDSIDDVLEIERKKMWNSSFKPLNTNIRISPIEEFWGHCSNIQAWVEYNYNTRLIDSKIGFPLLKKLADIGDNHARIRLKEEVIERLKSGHFNVIEFLVNEGFLDYFEEKEELEVLYESLGINSYNYDKHILQSGFLLYLSYSHRKEAELFAELLRARTSQDLILFNKEIIGENEEDKFKLPKLMINKEFGTTELYFNSQFNGFPDVICKFKNITKLSLNGNEIISVPNEINKMISLETLWLSHNKLSSLPDLFGELEKLEYLDLSNNRFRSIPQCIANLPKLKKIILVSNNLQSIPKFILNMKSLHFIDARENKNLKISLKMEESLKAHNIHILQKNLTQ
ncbi:MAG: leucine-rich repeat domain-containing protein [Promethearchaeota archaeon]|jgi:hypothetical protein